VGARERFATYIDGRLHLYRPCAVPVSSLVTFSLVQAPGATYESAGESAADWERHCWLMVGRGTLHHDLYVAPDSLTLRQWEAFLCLRNPAATRQPATFAPRWVLAVDAAAVLELEPVWGSAELPARTAAADRLDLELDPFAVLLFTATLR